MMINQNFNNVAYGSPLARVANFRQPQQFSDNWNCNSMDSCQGSMIQRMQAAQQADMLQGMLSMLQSILSGQGNLGGMQQMMAQRQQQMMAQQQNAAAFQQGFQQGAAFSQGYQAGLQAAHAHDHHGKAEHHGKTGHEKQHLAQLNNKAGGPAWTGREIGGPPVKFLSETGDLGSNSLLGMG